MIPQGSRNLFARCAGVWLYPVHQIGGQGDFPPGLGLLWHINAGRRSVVSRKRMQILYSGNVQGVGFRYTVKSVAAGFEVTGSVRNLPDGRVELIAEGTGDELTVFQQAIREAGLEHFIRNEDVSWNEAGNEFRGFNIVR
jgi:acylphosphatase